MDFFNSLKNLKKIKPDREFSSASRELILQSRPQKKVSWISYVSSLFMENVQFGSAVALTGILLALIVGGFSILKPLSPFRLTSLDPSGLKAEAQDIDIQIELANLKYRETEAAAAQGGSETPPRSAPALSVSKSESESKSAKASDLKTEAAPASSGAATSTEGPTVDDVLDILSQ